MQAHASFVLTKPSFEVGQYDQTPITTTSHNALTTRTEPPSPHSPHPSYYSVSDIPIPSPPPEPVYRYTTGEIASGPPTRAPSVYTVQSDAAKPSPQRSAAAPQLSHALQTALQNIGSAHQSRLSSGSTSSAGASSGTYEMRVRDSLHDQSENRLAPHPNSNHLDASRGFSEASYVTARDDSQEWLPDEPHDQHGLSGHLQNGLGIDVDQATIIQNRLSTASGDRPTSGSSWMGGLAL